MHFKQSLWTVKNDWNDFGKPFKQRYWSKPSIAKWSLKAAVGGGLAPLAGEHQNWEQKN